MSSVHTEIKFLFLVAIKAGVGTLVCQKQRNHGCMSPYPMAMTDHHMTDWAQPSAATIAVTLESNLVFGYLLVLPGIDGEVLLRCGDTLITSLFVVHYALRPSPQGLEEEGV